ncbi:AzlC family ABC transporter permease [Maritalea sp.]|jgi:4-azaleucine resistance transporter AzlC|uniref:AzlC family ABC transporter permease n=1 Tax=Maritalea sp. TaxID=2003361 RepID=UPI0039E6FB98
MTSAETPIPANMASEVRDGVREALPILVAIIPFAVMFGAVAVKAGFSVSQTVMTSAFIYAGASQFVMLDLLGQQAPAWSIILAVFALNFRHVLYSASLSQHLGSFSPIQKAGAFFLLVDPQFGMAETRAAKRKLQPSFYFSYAVLLYLTWIFMSFLGALFGSFITDPAAIGVDFILPLYFTGIVLGFRQRRFFWPIFVVSGISSALAYLAFGSPWNIAIGGIGGMIFAAVMSKPELEA